MNRRNGGRTTRGAADAVDRSPSFTQHPISSPVFGAVLRVLLSLAILLFGCSGCGLNSAKPVQSTHTGWFGNPTVIVFGVRTSGPDSHDIGFTRVTEDGRLAGGCFRYDHVWATVKGGTEKTQYFSYIAPPGLYSLQRSYTCDANVIGQTHPTCAVFPKAFSAGPGQVWYFGTFELKPVPSVDPNRKAADVIVRPVGRDFQSAARWANGRFHEPLRQATAWPNIPMFGPFMCFP